MKRSFIIALHTGYWLLYLLLLATFIMFMEAGGMSKLSQNHQHILGFIRIITLITIIPGVLGFYSAYFFLFNRFLSKKKIAALILAGLSVSLLAGLISILLLNLSTEGTLVKMGGLRQSLIMILFMSMLAMIHGIIALVMAKKEMALYNANPGMYTPASLSNIKTGRICAIIGIVLQGVAVLVYIIIFVVALGAIGASGGFN